MDRRNLLLVSYLFPPAGGVAVQRVLSLAKYLPRLGYNVHVLTARNPVVPTFDASLLKHVPEGVRVHRTFTPEVPYAWRKRAWNLLAGLRPAKASAGPAKSSGQAVKASGGPAAFIRELFSPDPEVVWTPFALRQARRIVRREGIGTVMVTVPPFSSLLIGNALKREFPSIALAADFRDEWLNFYLGTFNYHKGSRIYQRAAAIERETVERSGAVISVTASIIDELRERYPAQPAPKFVCIPNGYDAESFAGFTPRPHNTGRIVVSHVGTVYVTSSPRFYLDGVDRLPDSVRRRFETRFIGRVTPEEKPSLGNRASTVRELGFVPQSEAFRMMEETDFLLLVMRDANSLTGKIFEYLATGKPILAFAPKGGEVERIIRETNTGWCADPDDAAAIDRMLEQAVEAVSHPELAPRPNQGAIAQFERSRLVEEFHRAFASIG